MPHWTPYSIPLLTALRRFANPFRVASFGRADLTKFPWISPVTCEGDTALLLASCKRVYFLSDLTIRAAHSIVKASTSHTGRLILLPYVCILRKILLLGDIEIGALTRVH